MEKFAQTIVQYVSSRIIVQAFTELVRARATITTFLYCGMLVWRLYSLHLFMLSAYFRIMCIILPTNNH